MSEPTVPAENFLATVAANVENKKLSDAEFREFIRNTLPIVKYTRVTRPGVIVENPSYDHSDNFPFCAIRRRKSDGSQNVGGAWLEPMGPVTPYIADQRTWEVVFYKSGAALPD